MVVPTSIFSVGGDRVSNMHLVSPPLSFPCEVLAAYNRMMYVCMMMMLVMMDTITTIRCGCQPLRLTLGAMYVILRIQL